MLNGLTSHKYLLVFVLLTFLFSSNALCFGHHAAEEMLQAMNQVAAISTLEALSAEDTHAVFAHHHGQPDGGDSKNHDSNESHHSHDTEAATIALTFAALASSPLRFIEPFSYLPEVFFDRFIPPQNHA